MSTQSERTEIEVLKIQMTTAQKDISEIKADVKSIVSTLDGGFVTKAEFGEYKKSQAWQKIIIALGFTVIGALTTYFFTNVGK